MNDPQQHEQKDKNNNNNNAVSEPGRAERGGKGPRFSSLLFSLSPQKKKRNKHLSEIFKPCNSSNILSIDQKTGMEGKPEILRARSTVYPIGRAETILEASWRKICVSPNARPIEKLGDRQCLDK